MPYRREWAATVSAPDSLQEVADRLRLTNDAMVTLGEAMVHERIPSYRELSEPSLREAVTRNIELGILALGAGSPPAADLDSFIRRVHTRAEQNVPVEDMLRGIRLSFEPLHQDFTGLVDELCLSNKQILEGTRRLWEVVGTMTNRAAVAYQDHLILKTLADVEARSDFLRKVLHREYTAEQLAMHSLRYGLDPYNDVFVAIRAHTSGVASERVRRELERVGSTAERRAIIGHSDGDFIGVMPCRPPEVPGMVIGIGPQATLSEIARSFRIADLVFAAAQRTGEPGVFGAEDLTWRLLVDAEPVVNAALVHKYLDPLRVEDEFGEIIEQTVRAYLNHDRDLTRTARSLNIHPNTARYRLNRFCEFTGASLSSTRTLVDLAWLIEYRGGG